MLLTMILFIDFKVGVLVNCVCDVMMILVRTFILIWKIMLILSLLLPLILLLFAGYAAVFHEPVPKYM